MKRALTLTALLLVVPLTGVASQGDDVTSLSYISYMERYATLQPATQDESLEAVINMPVVPGDRIDTARGARLEVQLSDGSTLWLDEYTSVSLDAIAFSRGATEDRTVLYMADGSSMLEIPADGLTTHPTRVDSGGSTVYLTAPGLYRVGALQNGGLRVEVWDGLAEVATPSGGVLVRTGSAAEIDKGQLARTEDFLSQDDALASWVMARRQPPTGDTTRHIDERYQREASSLDRYGTWVYIQDSDTWAWQPEVTSTWSPYTYGRWYWTPAGWTWISYEPWGWVPFHYGTWFFNADFGWLWGWDSVWGPAWVDWMWWPGYVGWCPRGYYDWWYYRHYWGANWHHHGRDHRYNRGGPPRGRTRPQPEPGTAEPAPPRRVTSQMPAPSNGTPPSPSRFAGKLEGEVKLGEIDRKPWRVVPTSDFGSPHLGRLVRPLEDVVRDNERLTARVVSGPLTTDPPRSLAPGSLVENTFRRMELPKGRDLTPVLRTGPSLDAGAVGRLVGPMTTREVAGMARTPAQRSGAISPRPPVVTNKGTTERPTTRSPNIHRPRLDLGRSPTQRGISRPVSPRSQRLNPIRSGTGSGTIRRSPSPRQATPSRSGGQRKVVKPPSSNPRTSPSTPSTRSVRPGGSGGSGGSISRSSRTWSSPRVVPGRSGSSRSLLPRTRSYSGQSRTVSRPYSRSSSSQSRSVSRSSSSRSSGRSHTVSRSSSWSSHRTTTGSRSSAPRRSAPARSSSKSSHSRKVRRP